MEEDNTIVLPSVQVRTETIELPNQDTANRSQTNIEDAHLRAQKFDYGLGDRSPGVATLENLLNNPVAEDLTRNNMMMEDKIELEQQRLELLNQMVRGLAAENREMTPEERKDILDLSSVEVRQAINNPQTYFEQKYANKIVDDHVNLDRTETEEAPDVLANHIAKQEGFHRIYDEVRKRYEDTSTGRFVFDFAREFFIPSISWYQASNRVGDVPSVSFLPGSNILEQVRYLYTLPAEEAVVKARQAAEELSRDNILNGLRFAELLRFGGESDAFYEDFMGGYLTLAGWGLTGLGVVRGLTRGSRAASTPAKSAEAAAKDAEAYKEVLKAASKKNVKAHEVADAAGENVRAAGLQVAEKLLRRADQVGLPRQQLEDVMAELPTLFNTEKVISGASTNTSQEIVRRIFKRLDDYGDELLARLVTDYVDDTGRISQAALDVALQERLASFRKQYGDVHNAVLDAGIRVKLKSNVPIRTNGQIVKLKKPMTFAELKGPRTASRIVESRVNKEGGVFTAEINIGKIDGTLFDTESQADLVARGNYGLLPDTYTIEKKGNNYLIRVSKPLDIRSEKVRDVMRQELKHDKVDFNSTIGRALMSVRTGEDVLPESIRKQMKLALFGSTNIVDIMSNLMASVGKATDKQAFKSFLKKQQLTENRNSTSGMGVFSKTVADFEKDWLAHTNRLPTPDEIEAYFSYVKLNDIHYFQLNNSILLDKLAQGIEEYRFGSKGWFEGREWKGELPGKDRQAASIAIVMPNGTIIDRFMSTNEAKRVAAQKSLQKGFSAYQIDITEFRKFIPDVKDFHADIVIMPTPKSRPLRYQQLPYNPGGHHAYPSGNFIRVPKIGIRGNQTAVYYRDDTIFSVATAKDGEEIVKNLNKARLLYKELVENGRPDKAGLRDLRKFVETKTPFNWKEFKGLYTGEDALDVDAPFMMSAHNQSLYAKYGEKILEGRNKRPQLLTPENDEYTPYRTANMRFAAERGAPLRQAENVGTADNPRYGARRAELLDPILTLDRSLSDFARGRNMEIYKADAADRFVDEFGDLLEQPINQSRANPFLATINGKFREDIDPLRRQQAIVYRERMKQFLNMRSETQQYYDYLAQKLLGDVAPELATGWRKNMYEVLTTGDPATRLKGIAFHAKLGLWNIKQLLMQAQTFSHVMGIAGAGIGSRATLTAMIQNIVLHSDDLVGEGSRLMRALGWSSKEEFIEVTEAMKRVGWDNVGREVATREAFMNGSVVETGTGKVLDHGLYFFKKGEQFSRRTAWNAAYFRWREANPKGKLDDTALSTILNDADLLSNNMTQASNASWQRGLIAIPTQFWAYQVRLTEQLLSKRLTGAEKRRLLTTYSILYGIPVGGSALAVWPVHNNIRTWLNNQGIETTPDTVAGVLANGLQGSAVNLLAGEETNFSNVYGPSGLPFLRDVLFGEESFIETALGASGGVFTETIKDAWPLFRYVRDIIDPSTEAVPPTLREFTEVFGNITTLSSLEKAVIALSYGKFYTKEGTVIDEGNEGVKGVMMALFGVSPMRIEDMYLMLKDTKRVNMLKSQMRKDSAADFRRMLEADNAEDAAYYHNRIKIRMNNPMFTARERGQIMRDYVRSNQSLILENAQRNQTPAGRAYFEKLQKQREKEGIN